MKKSIVTGAVLLIHLFATAWAIEPSFDCDKASRPVALIICQSDALAIQDNKLAKLYGNLIRNASGEKKKTLKEEQRAWLKKRNAACNLDEKQNAQLCLLIQYRQRNKILSGMLAHDSSKRPEDKGLKILRVTPKGENVNANQQIVFQFDRPVVPIGRMERDAKDIPVVITPTLNCEWRWLNTRALACQLREEDKMAKATQYYVVMHPGITTEKGEQLSESHRHTFTTVRPNVRYTYFVSWLSPGTPLIQVSFNQPVTKSSVESTMTMMGMDNNDSHAEPVKVIAYPDDLPPELPWWQAQENKTEDLNVNTPLNTDRDDEARRVWIVEPRQELPLDQRIALSISPGLQSSEGTEIGIESRAVDDFQTFPAFKFLGIRCTLKNEKGMSNILLSTLTSFSAEKHQKCAPLMPVALIFSSPILSSMVKNHIDFTPRLDGDRKDYDPWENTRDWTRLTYPHTTHDWTRLIYPHTKGQDYQIWLPELLQANQKYSVSINSQEFKDEFGRSLPLDVSFDFFTGHREPNLKSTHDYAVLEKGVDSDVPLYITNLDNLTINYSKLGDGETRSGLQYTLETNKVENIAYAVPLGVRDLLGNDDSGIIYGAIHPNPKPPQWRRDPQILAQVTPFQVHVKLGHFNSQAWVTRFADGKPVEGAKISLHQGSYDNLAQLTNLDIQAHTDNDGLALLPGLKELDPKLELIYGGHSTDQPGFFAKVEADNDVAVLPINRSFSVRSSGTYPYLRKKGEHAHAWGTTAQGIYKLGDSVQFKIYVRDQSNKHWVSPPKETYELQVTDPQDKVIYEEKAITLNEFGAFDGEFQVPEQGAVGWYHFQLMPKKSKGEKYHRLSWSPMSVLVSDFTPSPFHVKTEINGEIFKANDKITIDSLATLHSGGPFTQAEIRLTARLTQQSFTTNLPIAKGFHFGGHNGTSLSREQRNLMDFRGKLDDFGQYEGTLTLPETDIYFGTIDVESAVKDDRGKFVASSSSVNYAGRDRFVGLKNTKWLYKKGKTARLETLVLDQQGHVAPGVKITIDIHRREYKASRVKGPGNAYLTKNIRQWVKETDCRLKSKKSVSVCEFKPKKPGYYQFTAKINDTQAREHSTTLHGWVTGSGSVIWDQTNDATLQIVAEQNTYHIGDTARYLIKNPFPGAKALVTVERYGILDSWVETLKTSTPVIEVPIKPDYLPGFYLSVVVLSPRVEKPLGPGKVDLGKPSYRMGYVSAKVSDPHKEIDIAIKTDKTIYKPREQVNATIQIQPKGTETDNRYEIAVAVIDESVLALNRKGDNYYDPYAGFNRLDSLDINNYSLISRLMGRQKFEKKGANPGGGGSSNSQLRNMFKYVSYWNPTITPDKNGKAEIEFTVPDNLTGWRIFAFAVNKDDRMGLGDANFKVNRPTEIRPVMPNQVIAGDHFKAGFSVMNRTDKPRKIAVQLAVAGPLATESSESTSYTINLAPYQRESVWLPVSTKGHGTLTFTAEGKDKTDGDAIQHTVPVNPRRSLETATSYGTLTAETVSESVKIPENIRTDAGYVGTALSPSVIGNLEGAFNYLKNYPHLCWEQRLTKAVAANAYIDLKTYLDKSVTWPKPKSDIERTLNSAANFQAPNGGMAYWVPSNAHVSPYLSAYTAMAFHWLRKGGHEIPTQIESRLHDYLLNVLRRDEFPTFYSKGMSSSVRAVALAALAKSGKINRSDINRYKPYLQEMDLFGKSHFLQAAINVANTADTTISYAIDDILGHADQSSGKFQFSEAWDDSYKYLLATPLRSNCAILSSFLNAQTDTTLGQSIGDIPFKLVRSITQRRGNRDHWENTQENVFCLNALVDYAEIYEATSPNMKVDVNFDSERLGSTTFSSKSDGIVHIQRALRELDPGKSAKLTINRTGEGRLYYSATVAYDLKDDHAKRIHSGIEIRREYSIERNGQFVLLTSPMKIKRGDIVKVDLYVSLPAARHFVVVNDPIPGGLEPVNTDLATASLVDAEKGNYKAAEGSWFYQYSDWSYYGRYFWSFYHKELRHDSARFYADYLPAGNYRLAYTAQAIAEGEFSVMPVSAEEMYDPDIYGKGLPATLTVSESTQ